VLRVELVLQAQLPLQVQSRLQGLVLLVRAWVESLLVPFTYKKHTFKLVGDTINRLNSIHQLSNK